MSETLTFRAETLAMTGILGGLLGRIAVPGDIITLTGPLGSGKTTLTQAIALGLDVPPEIYVTSPTFSIVHEYPGRFPVFHLDLYRLTGEDDLLDLGLEEYLYNDGICIVEWPDRLGSMLPADRLAVALDPVSAAARTISLAAHGKTWPDRLAGLRERLGKLTAGSAG